MIADMKHRMTIRQPVLTPDGAGGFSESWQDVATVYAAITPRAAGEQLKYGQIEATVTYQVVMRYRTDITSGMILLDEKGVAYNIISALAQPGQGSREKAYLSLLASVRPS